MNIQKNISLKKYSTIRLGGNAEYLSEAKSLSDLHALLAWTRQTDCPYIVIGSGSNIVWQDKGYNGLVIVNKIKGTTIKEVGGTNIAYFTFGAGEEWDSAVKKTVNMGYSGLEKLSLIPGTVGAAPVQNIGAYGAELKDTLSSLRAYDNLKHDFVTLTNQQCEFSYRSSIFKTNQKGRYIIVSVTVKLHKADNQPPFYSSLEQYLDQYNITDYSPSSIRKAVIAVRRHKLPDPSMVANSGSFFANPIVTSKVFTPLKRLHPDIPHWPMASDKIKLSAAWLIEQAGFARGFKDNQTGMALWKNQALVLVNEKAKTTADLIKFRDTIIAKVQDRFNITLEQEPELI